MCGIVGYVGDCEAVFLLLDGLRRLEYRGYDSAGVAIINDSGLGIRKSMGKLRVLDELVRENPISGRTGIGHTRWATHGKPSDANAHPHLDCKKKIALVHNGIIENYLSLREFLTGEGHIFQSETDTEVLAHLVEHYYEGSLEEALRKALKRVEGSYAIAAVSQDEPDRIVAARKDSPLVVSVGDSENFLASDIPAFLPYSRKVMYIQDNEIVVLTRDAVRITDMEGSPVEREVTQILWDADMAEKAGYKHFMLKEIYEQPRVLQDTLGGRLPDDDSIYIEELKMTSDEMRKIRRIIIIACGTAYHAGMVGKYLIEELARIPVDLDMASEFRYRNPIVDDSTLIVAISQSGETADTLAALREAMERGASGLAITNVVGSSITRVVDSLIYIRAGLEIGVAATKTFVAQMAALILLAILLGESRGTLKEEERKDYIRGLRRLPDQMKKILENPGEVHFLARKYYCCKDFLYLGRHINFPIALEGALKLKEISYIHAEGYAAGEMKHGPIALIDSMVPVISINTRGHVFEKTLSNIEEIRARDGVAIGVISDSDSDSEKSMDHVLHIPETPYLLSPILSIVPLQLLAYFIADRRGCDVDQPRNLAKSVTVE